MNNISKCYIKTRSVWLNFFSLLPWAPEWLDMAVLTIHCREGPRVLPSSLLYLPHTRFPGTDGCTGFVELCFGPRGFLHFRGSFSSPPTLLINSPSFTSFSMCQFLRLENGDNKWYPVSIAVVQSLSCVQLFATPRLPCLSLSSRVCSNSSSLSWWCHPTISSSVIPFSCLQSFPTPESFLVESALHIRWPKYWSFSFSSSPSNEYSGLRALNEPYYLHSTWQMSTHWAHQHHCHPPQIQ